MDRPDIEPAATTKAPAIGMSVTCNAGGDRQLVLQTFVDQEAGDEAANALADRLMRVADRQQAIYRIPGLEEEIEKVERAHAMFEENIAHVILTHAKQVATLDEQIVELQGKREEVFNTGYNAHVESGRRSEYKPQGSALSRLNAFDAQLEKLKEQRQKIMDEDKENEKNIQRTRDVNNGSIAKLKKQIEECRAKIG
jgi:hypothetical protein